MESGQHLSAIFRSFRDARDARSSLLDFECLSAQTSVFLFPMPHSADLAIVELQRHDVDRAEYAGHGEQMGMFSINWVSEPPLDDFEGNAEQDMRDNHTLLVAVRPPPETLEQICEALKDHGAFAIRLPSCRWRLCRSA